MEKFFESCIPLLEIWGAMGIALFMNMLFGIWQSCVIEKEKFDLRQDLVTIAQIILIGISAIGINGAFTILTKGMTALNINIKDVVTSTISVLSFMALFIKSFVDTCESLFNKIKNMLNVDFTVEEANEYIAPKIEVSGLSAEGYDSTEGVG